MKIDDYIDNDCVLTTEEAILLIHRLNPLNWSFDGITMSKGDIPIHDDDNPDKPIIIADTDSLRDIDQGKVTINISARHGQRYVCPSCGQTMNVKKWIRTEYHTSPLAGMKQC